jgi:hypothetical protein
MCFTIISILLYKYNLYDLIYLSFKETRRCAVGVPRRVEGMSP